ncbi:MAG: hypothetical protein ACRD3D_13160 [Terriglobia bacterium]
MPASALPLDQIGIVNLPAISSSATVLSFRLQPGRSGVIRWIANELRSNAGAEIDWPNLGGVTWTFLVNNQPVAQSYGVISATLGRIFLPAEISIIRLKENDLVTLSISNGGLAVTAPAQMTACRWLGWYYPKELDREFLG